MTARTFTLAEISDLISEVSCSAQRIAALEACLHELPAVIANDGFNLAYIKIKEALDESERLKQAFRASRADKDTA